MYMLWVLQMLWRINGNIEDLNRRSHDKRKIKIDMGMLSIQINHHILWEKEGEVWMKNWKKMKSEKMINKWFDVEMGDEKKINWENIYESAKQICRQMRRAVRSAHEYNGWWRTVERRWESFMNAGMRQSGWHLQKRFACTNSDALKRRMTENDKQRKETILKKGGNCGTYQRMARRPSEVIGRPSHGWKRNSWRHRILRICFQGGDQSVAAFIPEFENIRHKKASKGKCNQK